MATTIWNTAGDGLSAYERARYEIARVNDVDRKGLEFAAQIVQDDELFDSAQDARVALKAASPRSLHELVRRLNRGGVVLRLRTIGRRTVPMSALQRRPATFIYRLAHSLAQEVVRCNPRDPGPIPSARKTLAGDGIHLPPDDPGPEELDELGFGIFSDSAPEFSMKCVSSIGIGSAALLAEFADPFERLELTSLQRRARRLAEIERLGDDLRSDPKLGGGSTELEAAIATLESLAQECWTASYDADAVTLRIVRSVARALAPSGATLSTHRVAIFTYAGRLLELGKLGKIRNVGPPSQRDFDGLRYARVRQVVHRFDCAHGKGAALREIVG